MKEEYQHNFLKVLRYFSTEWVEPKCYRIPYDEYYPQNMTGDKIIDKCNKEQPRRLMEHIECFEYEGLIVVDRDVYGWELPPIKITPKGIKYLERPCWIKRIIKNAFEKASIKELIWLTGIILSILLIIGSFLLSLIK